jgi:hypothetical protein
MTVNRLGRCAGAITGDEGQGRGVRTPREGGFPFSAQTAAVFTSHIAAGESRRKLRQPLKTMASAAGRAAWASASTRVGWLLGPAARGSTLPVAAWALTPRAGRWLGRADYRREVRRKRYCFFSLFYLIYIYIYYIDIIYIRTCLYTLDHAYFYPKFNSFSPFLTQAQSKLF